MRPFQYLQLLTLRIAADGVRNSGDGPEEEVDRFGEHEDIGEHELVSQGAGQKTSDNGFCGRVRVAPEPKKGKRQGTVKGQRGSETQKTGLIKIVSQLVVPAPNFLFPATAVGKLPVHGGIQSASWPAPEEQTFGRCINLGPGNFPNLKPVSKRPPL